MTSSCEHKQTKGGASAIRSGIYKEIGRRSRKDSRKKYLDAQPNKKKRRKGVNGQENQPT
jgi:hypothetical protein